MTRFTRLHEKDLHLLVVNRELTIEGIGYAAAPVAAGTDDESPTADNAGSGAERVPEALKHRLIGATVLGVPVLALSMIKPLQFTNWQWLTLALAAPIVLWGAWPFHRSAWLNIRHGAAARRSKRGPSAGRGRRCECS